MLTLLFVSGIFLSSYVGQIDLLMISCILVSMVFMVLVYLGRLRSSYFFIGLAPVFVLLGMYLYQENSGKSKLLHFTANYSQDDGLIGELIEIKAGDGEWARAVFQVSNIVNRNKSVHASTQILLYIKNSTLQVEAGDVLLVSSELIPIKNKNNPGEFDAESYWINKGIGYMSFVEKWEFHLIDEAQESTMGRWLRESRAYLNATIEQYFSEQHASLLKAIILGDKSKLDQETRTTFGNSGAMHLLAVSGLHVGIFLLLLMFLFQRVSNFISRGTALFFIVIILWLYALITGFSPSVFRAVFMFTVLAVGQVLSRRQDPINVLFFSGFVVLIFAPQQLFDIGFQLSYAAMLGIFLFYERVESIYSFKFWLLRKAWQGTAVGLSAQLMTLPLTLGYFHQFPNYFIISNLGLMVFSGFLLGLGLALFVVRFIPFLNKLIAFALFVVVFLLLEFLGWIEYLPGAVAQGYSIDLLQGITLSTGILLLMLNLGGLRLRWVGAFVVVFTVLSIVSDRFDRMQSQELCVFNSNKVIIAVKSGGQIHCFHNAEEEEMDKVERVISDYSRLNPGEVFYHPIFKKDSYMISDDLNTLFSSRNGYFELGINDYKFYLTTSYQVPKLHEQARMIHMPWVKNEQGISLKDGAFCLPLN